MERSAIRDGGASTPQGRPGLRNGEDAAASSGLRSLDEVSVSGGDEGVRNVARMERSAIRDGGASTPQGRPGLRNGEDAAASSGLCLLRSLLRRDNESSPSM